MLCDTGPLIAIIDRDDRHHRRCVEALSAMPPAALVTIWPCLTEAMHLLHRIGGLPAQNELWGLLADGLVRLYLPNEAEWQRIHELMNQYGDMPLDMADASLVSAAEQLPDRSLFSIDNRLRAIRLASKRGFDVVP
jgi:predicted nucleic acid-binding protein